VATRQTIKLASLPVRLGAAVGLVALAYYAPWIAATLLVLVWLGAVTSLLVVYGMRRAFRWRARVSCSNCTYRPLRIARICPECHTPVLLADIRKAPEHLRPALHQTATCMAGAAGPPSETTRSFLKALTGDAELEAEKVATAQQILLPQALSTGDSELILRVAASMAVADRRMEEVERSTYFAIAQRLPLPKRRARALLREYEQQIVG
jgi:hypothetical protein